MQLIKNKPMQIALPLTMAVIILVALPFIMPSDYLRQLLVQSLIYIVIVVGYNFVTGDIGQLSMAQQGFFALGAYFTAIFSTTAGLSWWTSVALAIIFTTIIGALVGLPTLRVRGQYLIMVTMAFSEIVRLLATNLSGLTGGASGITKIPSPKIGTFVFSGKISLYFLFLIITCTALLIAHRIRITKYGRTFLAIRDGELAADVMGINTTAIKVMAFSLAAAYAALGGGMFAASFNYISPDSFGLGQTVLILAMLLIGGEGSIAGAITGAIVLTYLPELLRFARNYYILIYGSLIVLITLFLPGGIVGFAVKYLQKKGILSQEERGKHFDAMDLVKKNVEPASQPSKSGNNWEKS